MVPSRARHDAAHVIRLLGPWEGATQCGMRSAEWGNDALVYSKPTRVKVPLSLSDWLSADFRGTVILERAFGLPTNLDDRQSVQLVLQTDQLNVETVSLNGVELLAASANASMVGSTGNETEPSSLRYRIGDHLQARNRLRLTVSIDATPCGSLSNAAIEIHG